MVLATKQHTVTIVDSEEFSNARNGLTGTGITNAAKGRNFPEDFSLYGGFTRAA